MESIRLGSRLRNGVMSSLLDEDIEAVEQEEHRYATRAEINRLLQEGASEVPSTADVEQAVTAHERPANVVPLRPSSEDTAGGFGPAAA